MRKNFLSFAMVLPLVVFSVPAWAGQAEQSWLKELSTPTSSFFGSICERLILFGVFSEGADRPPQKEQKEIEKQAWIILAKDLYKVFSFSHKIRDEAPDCMRDQFRFEDSAKMMDAVRRVLKMSGWGPADIEDGLTPAKMREMLLRDLKRYLEYVRLEFEEGRARLGHYELRIIEIAAAARNLGFTREAIGLTPSEIKIGRRR